MTSRFCRRWLCAGLLTATVAMLAPASAEQGYRPYRNWRFGVSAEVPSDWKAGREPDNNDGLAFTSPDGAATITVSGILNADDAPAAELIADEQRARRRDRDVSKGERAPSGDFRHKRRHDFLSESHSVVQRPDRESPVDHISGGAKAGL
jgi:hypothetical protein